MTGLVERLRKDAEQLIAHARKGRRMWPGDNDFEDAAGRIHEAAAEIERLLSQLQAAEAERDEALALAGRQAENIRGLSRRLRHQRAHLRHVTKRDPLGPPWHSPRYHLGQHLNRLYHLWQSAEAEVSKLKAQVETARAALQPFAASYMAGVIDTVPDLADVKLSAHFGGDLELEDYLPVGEFRAAAQALRALSDEVNDGQ